MVLSALSAALCVALSAAAAGHTYPAPYSPYTAPGHHWYRYQYGGTVAAPLPAASAGTPQYASGYGYDGLYGKPYVKVYNYRDSREQRERDRELRRGHGRGRDAGDYSRAYDRDYSRAYARDYDYNTDNQKRGGFKYVREYYKDRYHHSREHERYYPADRPGYDRHDRYGPDRHGPGWRRPYDGERRRGPTVIVLGSKKAHTDDYPQRVHPPGGSHGGYPGGHPGGYPDDYPQRVYPPGGSHGGHHGGHHGGSHGGDHGGSSGGHRTGYQDEPYPEHERGQFSGGLPWNSLYDKDRHSGNRHGNSYHSGGKTYHNGGKSYYGGGGYQSVVRGSGDYPRGGGTSYYGGGGYNDDVPVQGHGQGYGQGYGYTSGDTGVTGGIGENLFNTKHQYRQDDYQPHGGSYPSGISYHDSGSKYQDPEHRSDGDYSSNTAGSYHSDTGSNYVDGGTYQSGAGSYHSDAGNYQSNTGSYHSDAGNYPSDTGSYQSNVGNYPSDTGSYQSDAGSYSSDGGNYQSEVGKYQSGTGSYHSGAANYQQSGAGSYPTSYHVRDQVYDNKDDVGGSYHGRHGNDDDGFVSLSSVSRPSYRRRKEDDDRRYMVSLPRRADDTRFR